MVEVVERVIVSNLNKKWPDDREMECPCSSENWPFLVWGITSEMNLVTLCPVCKKYAFGQEYDDD